MEDEARAGRAADRRVRLGGPLQLPGPAGGRRPRLPGDRGSRRRRPAPAHRADARDRPPLQRALRPETLVVPEHRIPEIGARIMDLQDPTSKMSTTGGGEAGTVYVLDEPDAIRKKFRSAVDRLRAARSAAPGPRRQGGDREPDRHPLRRPRRRRPRRSRRSSRAPATATSRRPSATRSPSSWRPVRERYAELRDDPDELERDPRAGADEGPRDRRPGPRRRPRGDGRRRAALEPQTRGIAISRRRSSAPSRSIA